MGTEFLGRKYLRKPYGYRKNFWVLEGFSVKKNLGLFGERIEWALSLFYYFFP
jgi:hypothetical protein